MMQVEQIEFVLISKVFSDPSEVRKLFRALKTYAKLYPVLPIRPTKPGVRSGSSLARLGGIDGCLRLMLMPVSAGIDGNELPVGGSRRD